MTKRLSHQEFEYIFKRAPRLCVEVVVKNSQGVLLTLRNILPSKGYWHLPGGTVLHGEKLEQAVKRIAKTELGVDVKVEKPLGIIEYFNKSTIFGHAVSIAYLVNLKSNHIKLDRQASEFRYFKNVPDKTIKETKEFLYSL